MGTCSSCGNSGMFLSIKYCWTKVMENGKEKQCQRRFCEKCGFDVNFIDSNQRHIEQRNICSQHFEDLLYHSDFEYHRAEGVTHIFKSKKDNSTLRVIGWNAAACYENVMRYKQQRHTELQQAEENKRIQELNEKMRMANNFLLAERFEDSAKLYEELGMWKEAGEARRKGKENVNITKIIKIDANQMFSQIKNEGLAIPYKCPSCSGTLKIDGNNRIDRCPFCGTEIDMKTLSDLVNTIIS